MKLKHFALYAKGHYVMSDDLISDLRKCFDADDYCGEYMTKHDMVTILTRNIAPLFRDAEHMTNLLLEGIDPKQCWKRGYYHSTDYRDAEQKNRDGEKHNQPYDMHVAVIKFFMSEIRFSDVKRLDGLPEPDDKVLPLTWVHELAKTHALIEMLVPELQELEERAQAFTDEELWSDERIEVSIQLDETKKRMESLSRDLEHWTKIKTKVDSTRANKPEEVRDSTT